MPDNPPASENITLVYGGGGRFTSHWGGVDEHLAHLTHPRVKRGIILPHSFYDVDFFIQGLDERHTIICREKRSYDYCRSLESSAKILLGDDMGMQLNIADLPEIKDVPELNDRTNKEELLQHELLQRGWIQKVMRGVRKSTISSRMNGKNKKISFLLRTDKEKSTVLSSPLSYDISLSWDASCRETTFNSLFVSVLAAALKYPDVIVTDRLHVGIMSHLCGKEVYLLDNDYGKLSGVYKQTLLYQPNVHLLPNGELTEELTLAWRRFNSPLRIALHKLASLIVWWNRLKPLLKSPGRFLSVIKKKIRKA